MDALDSRAEGLILTPGRDAYAAPEGRSPKTLDETVNGTGENTNQRLPGTPLGPSMACNIFGGKHHGTPRKAGAQHGEETHPAPEGHDNTAMDGMDIEMASDDGGPWLRARVCKR